MLRRFSRAAALLAGATAIVAIASSAPVSASAYSGATTASTSAASFGAEQAALYPIQRALSLSVPGNCAAVRHELSGLAREGFRSAACTQAAPASLTPGARAALAASLCVPGRIERTRHAACAVTAISYEVVQVPSGKVLGTGEIGFVYAEALSNRSWRWTLDAAIELIAATGVVRVGTVATTAISCGNCTASAPWVQLLRVGAPHSHAFSVTARGGAVTTTHQAPVVEISNPAATVQAPPARFTNLGPARCDKIAVAGSAGCVFSDVAATYLVHLKGHNEDQVAANVEKGQRTKPHHFGWFGHGTPLMRATSVTIQNRNRQAACGRTHFRRPFSCDEYPFAATFQGAFFFPGDSQIARVLGSQNSAESGFRTAMYRNERVLNRDPYWVFVVP